MENKNPQDRNARSASVHKLTGMAMLAAIVVVLQLLGLKKAAFTGRRPFPSGACGFLWPAVEKCGRSAARMDETAALVRMKRTFWLFHMGF